MHINVQCVEREREREIYGRVENGERHREFKDKIETPSYEKIHYYANEFRKKDHNLPLLY